MPRFARTASALAAAVLTAGCSVFGGQAAPEPDYDVLVSEPPFEIRAYPALAVARTTAESSRDRAVGRGFGRLFDYISGENLGEREIAMTAPVVTEPDGTEIAMTAPVMTEEAGGDGRWTTMFVLPGDMTAETAPVPADDAVEIATIPARTVAVVRFSGFFSGESVAEERRRLAAWLDARPEEVAGDWQAAGYNPPWTLPWLRRNEVMVPVSGRAAAGG